MNEETENYLESWKLPSACPDNQHVPDWETICPDADNPAVIEVHCMKCQQSGRITLKAEHVEWSAL